MDIAAFIKARLDEDERIAAAAGQGWYGYDPQTSIAFVDRADTEHIAHHGPARVLREVEAKRQLLDLHPPDGSACTTCARSHMEEFYDSETEQETYEAVFTEVDFPCPTVRLLALPNADHPDYREEWRP